MKYAILFLAVSALPAAAQPCATGGWSYYGLANGPTIETPPADPRAYGSFWLNPVGLHRPPVPTYGPTPAMVAGPVANHSYYTRPGLGWFGVYNPSPRPRTTSVSVK